MSYLDVPRIHFSGEFWADPSTVNNEKGNYATAVDRTSTAKLWNQNGTHWFQFNGCKVRAALDDGGVLKQTRADDAIVDGTVETTNIPKFAKLVDLDPEYQLGSQIWGLELEVSLSNGDGTFKGRLDTATMRDVWFKRASPGGMAGAGGVYQSVLSNVTWDTSSRSSVFDQLGAASTPQPTKLSIKFVLYAYDPSSGPAGSPNPKFRFGKVVGTIGPALPNEPDHFVPAHRVDQIAGGDAFGKAVYKIDTTRKKIVLDLGHCIPEISPGGAPRDFGAMMALVMPISTSTFFSMKNIDYKTDYEATAGIRELDIDAADIAKLNSSGYLAIAVSKPSLRGIISERSDGTYVDASEVVFRLNPGEDEEIELIATERGSTKVGQSLGLKLSKGTPASALTFPASVTTDADGRANVKFTAGDPKSPRPGIDGQLYEVGFYWGAEQRGTIRVLVFNGFTPKASPKWADVRPIFEQYAKLYPFMTSLIDLGDLSKVKGRLKDIKATLDYDETDSRYMPVTRDLSKAKRNMIIKWINRGAPV